MFRCSAFLIVPVSLLAASSTAVHAQVDTLTTVVNSATATNGKSLASFAYNPLTEQIFVSSFGATPFAAAGAVRRIDNLNTTPTGTDILSEAQLQLYYRENDASRSVSTPLQSGFLFNPQAIGAIPAYSQIWVADAALTRLPYGSTTVDPAATKRVYRYDPFATVTTHPFNNVTLTTLANLQSVLSTANTSSNWGRQFAWSSDGQFLYHNDSSTVFGGTWKINAATGAAQRINTASANTEPAVLNLGGGIDRIIFRGTTEAGNLGGLDFIDHNLNTNTTTSVAVFLSAAALNDFLDRPAGAATPTTFSMTSDAQGNLYFNDTASGGGGTRTVTKMDSSGRLVKVFSYAERQDTFDTNGTTTPNPNSNTLRMQTRTVTHPTAGSITQLMYAESSPFNFIAGAYIFDEGDFDRDGDVDSSDRSAFLAALETRGTPMSGSLSTEARYDLNGNGNIDWKDVKILQQFLGFANGDINLDGAVDYTDLDTMFANYHTQGGPANKTWAQGDLASLDPLATTYSAAAIDANLVNFVDLQVLAANWSLTAPTLSQLLGQGYTGLFLDDTLAAFSIPEPGSAVVWTALMLAMIRGGSAGRRGRSTWGL